MTVNPDVMAVNIVVSGCEFEDTAGQVDDAIAFLKVFGEELRTLCQSGLTRPPVLDFAASITWDIFSKSVRFPPELLALSGKALVEIEVSAYTRGPDPE